jgi:outer membrane protein
LRPGVNYLPVFINFIGRIPFVFCHCCIMYHRPTPVYMPPFRYLLASLLLAGFSCIFFAPLAAQTPAPLLSAEDAVKIALENAYEIRIAQADAAIATANNTKGNAGMLPNVNLVVNENFTLSSFQQKLVNGTEFNALGAPFNAASAGVQLSWTLFDGRRMYITKKRLEQTQALGELNLQNQVQQTTAAVLQAYYEVVRGRLQETAITEVITLTEERLRIAEVRLAAGFAAQTDALQARIELNQRRSDLLVQQTATQSAKRNLNRLLARDSETAFDVDNRLESAWSPDPATLVQKIGRNNASLLALQKSAEVAALQADEAATLNKPRIVGNSQFNAQRTDNGAGFLKNNTQAGLTIGASLVLPLYTGGNNQRQLETARLGAQQAMLRSDLLKQTLDAELYNQVAQFQTQRAMLALEEDNVKNARENLKISTERFRLGQTNSLETQNAQNTLEQALFRRNLTLFNLKSAEIRLRLLAGEL